MRNFLLLVGLLVAIFAYAQAVPAPANLPEAGPEAQQASFAVLQKVVTSLRNGNTGVLRELVDEEQKLYQQMREAVRDSLLEFIEDAQNTLADVNNDEGVENEQRKRVLKSAANQLETIVNRAATFLEEWDELQNEVSAQRDEDRAQALQAWLQWSSRIIKSVSVVTQGNQEAVMAAEKVLENEVQRYYMILDECDDDVEDQVQFLGVKLRTILKRYQEVLESLGDRVENVCLTSEDNREGAESCRAEICELQNQLQRVPAALQSITEKLQEMRRDESCYIQIKDAFERGQKKLQKEIKKAVKEALLAAADANENEIVDDDEDEDSDEDVVAEESAESAQNSSSGLKIATDEKSALEDLERRLKVNFDEIGKDQEYNYCRA